MLQYTRLNALLEYFMAHPGCIIPSELTTRFHISERTLRNDIRTINKELKKYASRILMKRKTGYYLQVMNPQTKELLKELIKEKNEPLDSPDMRIQHLVIMLLYANTYVTQDDMADEVFVSINTIINYIKTIRLILSNYELILQTKANLGYTIIGTEVNKRKCIIDVITSTYHQYALDFSLAQKTLLKNVNLEKIKNIVIQFNQERNMHFSDYNLRSIILHIALSISRIQAANPLSIYDMPNSDFIRDLLNPLITLIEQDFQVNLNDTERKYIYSHYISNANELLSSDTCSTYIHTLVDNITNTIFTTYHFDLRNDLILERDLQHHLQAILNTKKYQLSKKNPLLNTIKHYYILAYEVTEIALNQVFSNEPFTLTEDEIGYISLHVGASIERYFDSRNIKHKRAMIIYDSGYAVGSFIAAKLQSIFKDSLEIVDKLPAHEFNKEQHLDIDIIISTVFLEKFEIPVVIVDLPIKKKDIERITRIITMDTVHPVKKIAHFFDSELFAHIYAKDKEDCIHQLSQLLVQKKYVYSNFEYSVLEREAKIPTAIDGIVAIPHPLKMCAIKSVIAIGILDAPLSWSKQHEVQIIFMLALADDVKKDIEKLYDTFVAIANNTSLQNTLVQAPSLSDFLDCLISNIPIDYYM